MPNYEQITGILRAIVPAIIAFAASKHWIPGIDDTSIQLIIAAIVAIVAAVWSVITHTQAKTIAVVAGMEATEVAPDGKTIVLLNPELVKVAKDVQAGKTQ